MEDVKNLQDQINSANLATIRNHYRELKRIDIRLMADATFREMDEIQQKVWKAENIVTAFEEMLAKVDDEGQPFLKLPAMDLSTLMNLKETVRCLQISMKWVWRDQYKIKEKAAQLSA